MVSEPIEHTILTIALIGMLAITLGACQWYGTVYLNESVSEGLTVIAEEIKNVIVDSTASMAQRTGNITLTRSLNLPERIHESLYVVRIAYDEKEESCVILASDAINSYVKSSVKLPTVIHSLDDPRISEEVNQTAITLLSEIGINPIESYKSSFKGQVLWLVKISINNEEWILCGFGEKS